MIFLIVFLMALYGAVGFFFFVMQMTEMQERSSASRLHILGAAATAFAWPISIVVMTVVRSLEHLLKKPALSSQPARSVVGKTSSSL